MNLERHSDIPDIFRIEINDIKQSNKAKVALYGKDIATELLSQGYVKEVCELYRQLVKIDTSLFKHLVLLVYNTYGKEELKKLHDYISSNYPTLTSYSSVLLGCPEASTFMEQNQYAYASSIETTDEVYNKSN